MNHLKTSFKVDQVIKSTSTGSVALISSDNTLLVTTNGPSVYIHSLSKDNKNILSFNLSQEEFLSNIIDEDDSVAKLALTSDNKILFFGYKLQGLVQVYSISNKKLLKSWKPHDGMVLCMTVLSDGTKKLDHSSYDGTKGILATGSSDHTIKLWTFSHENETFHMTQICQFKGHSGIINSLLWSPVNSDELFSGSEDGEIRSWSFLNQSFIGSYKSHTGRVTCLTISEKNHFLISASRDNMIMIWDTQTRKCLKAIPMYEAIETLTYIHSKNGLRLWTGGESGIAKEWDLVTGKLLRQYPNVGSKENGQNLMPILHLFNLGDSHVVRMTSDNLIEFIELENLSRDRLLIGHNEEITDLSYLTVDDSFLAVATNAPEIRIYQLKGHDHDSTLLYGHQELILCLMSDPMNGLLYSGSKDKSARIWKYEIQNSDGKLKTACVAICEGHTEAVGAICASKSGFWMVTASSDKTIKCWDIPSLTIPKDFLSGDNNNIKPLQLDSRWTIKAHDKDISCLDISPNDKMIASASQDKSIKIWDPSTGSQLGCIANAHTRSVWTIRFSSVDQCLFSGSADRKIKIWSLKDFTCLKSLEGHTNSILKLIPFNRSTQLVSAGADGILKVWDIKSAECITNLDQHVDKIWALALNHREDKIVSGSADTTVIFWQDVTEMEAEKSRIEKSAQVQKEQEWNHYYWKKDYKNAIYLALSMKQPFRLYNLLKEVFDNCPNEGDHDGKNLTSLYCRGKGTPHLEVNHILSSLSDEELGTLFSFIRDWNTHFKRSFICQSLLSLLLTKYSKDRLLGLPQMKEYLTGLLPYSERHYQRYDDTLISQFIIDQTLTQMNALMTI